MTGMAAMRSSKGWTYAHSVSSPETITTGTVTRAYPYGELGQRSAVNDVVGGRPVVIVYDAEAQMALAFDRRADGETLTFEVAGSGFPFRLRDVETGSESNIRHFLDDMYENVRQDV